MRILTIVDLPWDARLGATRIFMELSQAWETAGHEVSHYCMDDAFPAATSSPPISAWRRLRFPGRAGAFVRNNAARFDVIDCLAGTLPVAKHRLNFAGLLIARSIGSHRLYRNFEEMARERWPEQPRGKLSGRIFYTIFQQQLFRNSEKALQFCDLVNLPNEYELEYLSSKKPAIVQPYGLTEEWRRTLVEAAASPETRLLRQEVSFIGMWSTRKGAKDWGEIIQRVRGVVPGARFKFLGTLTDNEKLWRDLNIPPCDWIEIVPEYQPDELPKLLSDSTVGAFPSYAEGFGLGLLEQLAAGIPTVSYDAPGPRFILQGGLSDLLVPIGNVEQLSAALIQILSADLDSYRKVIERCIEVAGRFLWPTIAKETARLYETHLARVRGGISDCPGMTNGAAVVWQIVPRVSDNPDGVTDYAFNLANTLWANHGLRTVFAPGEPSQASRKGEFEIASIADAGAPPAKPAHVILHYVNYGYQKRGLPFWLVPILGRVRETFGGRLIVIFHELFAIGPPWKSEFWLQPLQKKIARDIARLTDARLVSSESMQQTLEGLVPGLDVVVHPVPSAFGEPVIDFAQLQARDNHRWVICGGTELIERSLRSFRRITGEISSNVLPRSLVVLGGMENSRVRPLLQTLAAIQCEYYPAVSPETASQILSTCAFAWLDYFTTGTANADLLLKSSSFANVCAHAVVCVTPRAVSAISLENDLLPGPFTIAHGEVKMPSGNERPDIARAIYDWYHRHASMATLSRVIAAQLAGSATGPVRSEAAENL